MSAHDKHGLAGVPKRSLVEMLALGQRILEGMQKHGKDPGYPTVLDTIGLPAARDRAATAQANAEVTKLSARKAAGEAAAIRTQYEAVLEQMHTYLLAAYGKQNPALFDYGFRPLRSPGKRKKASASAAGHKAGAHKAAGGASSGAPSESAPGEGGGGGEAGAPGSSGSSTPPGATPHA